MCVYINIYFFFFPKAHIIFNKHSRLLLKPGNSDSQSSVELSTHSLVTHHSKRKFSATLLERGQSALIAPAQGRRGVIGLLLWASADSRIHESREEQVGRMCSPHSINNPAKLQALEGQWDAGPPGCVWVQPVILQPRKANSTAVTAKCLLGKMEACVFTSSQRARGGHEKGESERERIKGEGGCGVGSFYRL